MIMKKMLNEDILVHDGQSNVDLKCMASLSISDSVKDHLQSIIAKSSKLVSELRSGLVSSTHTIINFFKRLSSLCERHQSKIPSYDRGYNVRIMAM